MHIPSAVISLGSSNVADRELDGQWLALEPPSKEPNEDSRYQASIWNGFQSHVLSNLDQAPEVFVSAARSNPWLDRSTQKVF